MKSKRSVSSQMSDNELTEFTWEDKTPEYVDSYNALDHRFHGVYSKSAKRLSQLAKLNPGQTVIDLGCGTGTSTRVFWETVAPSGSVLGIDLSPEMVKRAQAKFVDNNKISFLVDSAFNISAICDSLGIRGQVDAILSNFTYYYMYEGREELQRDIFACLRPGGAWAFNITTYLGEIEEKGKKYNTFSPEFFKALQEILVERGIISEPEQFSGRKENLTSATWDKELLGEIGFSKVHSEAWPLPLSPSEGFEFTIEGFYKHGSKITFSKALMELDLYQRTQIMMEALDRSRQALDNTNQHPTILNIVAIK